MGTQMDGNKQQIKRKYIDFARPTFHRRMAALRYLRVEEGYERMHLQDVTHLIIYLNKKFTKIPLAFSDSRSSAPWSSSCRSWWLRRWAIPNRTRWGGLFVWFADWTRRRTTRSGRHGTKPFERERSLHRRVLQWRYLSKKNRIESQILLDAAHHIISSDDIQI